MSKSRTNKATPSATVWLVDIRTVDDEQLSRFAAWLSQSEQERHGRFLRRERQQQFLVGRVLLRIALGRLLSVSGAAISLAERPGGAPHLDWSEPAPEFSLSHSGPWVACAVSADIALGLDIEVMDPSRDLIASGNQAFGVDDIAWRDMQANQVSVADFYRLWSMKEASYKLASSSGMQSDGSCIALPHPELSLVLCSATPLASVLVHGALECASIGLCREPRADHVTAYCHSQFHNPGNCVLTSPSRTVRCNPANSSSERSS